jgi:hypothetical protein
VRLFIEVIERTNKKLQLFFSIDKTLLGSRQLNLVLNENSLLLESQFQILPIKIQKSSTLNSKKCKSVRNKLRVRVLIRLNNAIFLSFFSHLNLATILFVRLGNKKSNKHTNKTHKNARTRSLTCLF